MSFPCAPCPVFDPEAQTRRAPFVSLEGKPCEIGLWQKDYAISRGKLRRRVILLYVLN